ncbi:hypothetical protein DRP77_05170 [Candidatus Poribacteria bacterium]|nr:MAG: hypothetical protein DRP77_05170 [Candidatus Poribacteria bacterium]
MTRFFALMSLVFYFFAVLFGLILFTGRYSATTTVVQTVDGKTVKLDQEKLKMLKEELKKLEEQIAQKRKELSKLEEQIAEANGTIEQLRGEITVLTAQKRSLEQGQSLATLYNSMQPEDVASLIAKADDRMIDMIVRYVFPYMRERNVGRIMSSLTKSSPQVAVKIVQMMAKLDEEAANKGSSAEGSL